MLLSIAMIVKNEEKYLKNTLESLKMLTKRISSEIIVVDTGSDDDTVKIAKEYTNNVYLEKWNDSFAEMRNKSISYCKGEWILILDADEELIKCDNLVEFLTSNKSKTFNTAKIVLKNLISSTNHSQYIMANCVRIFRNKDNFRYEGCIHEQPQYEQPEYEEALAEFNHYGYIYEDKHFKRNKLKRNEKLLLKEYHKDREDIYINYQLAKNYMGEDKYNIAISFLEDALKLNKNTNNKNRYIYIYEELCKAYYLNEDYDLCEQKCKEYIKKIDNNNIDVYYYLANAQKMNKDSERSIESYKKYLNLVNNYHKSTQFKSVYSINSTGCNKVLGIERLMDTYYKLERYEDVINLYEEVARVEESSDEIIFLVIKTLLDLNKVCKINEYYKFNCKNSIDKNKFIIQIEKNLEDQEKLKLQNIYNELSKIEDNYGKLNQIRSKKTLEIQDCIKILQHESNCCYSDIINIMIINNISIEEYLNLIDISKLQIYIDYIVENKEGASKRLYKILGDNDIRFNIKYIKVYVCIINSLLKKSNLDLECYKILMLYYNVYQYNYIKYKYRKELSDLDILENTMDESEKFLLEMRISENEKYKNISNYIQIIKEISAKYPSYINIIKVIKEEIKAYGQESKEINKLRIEYKNKIRKVIELNNIEAAKNMIDEYKVLFRDDPNIMNMESVIHIMENEIQKANEKIKYAYLMDSNNPDILFNMAYIYELQDKKLKAKEVYMFIVDNFKGEIIDVCIDRINCI